MNKLLLSLAASLLLLCACGNSYEQEVRAKVTTQITTAKDNGLCYAPINFDHEVTDKDYYIVDATAKAQHWYALREHSGKEFRIVDNDTVRCPLPKQS